jgi:hypothetical protein
LLEPAPQQDATPLREQRGCVLESRGVASSCSAGAAARVECACVECVGTEEGDILAKMPDEGVCRRCSLNDGDIFCTYLHLLSRPRWLQCAHKVLISTHSQTHTHTHTHTQMDMSRWAENQEAIVDLELTIGVMSNILYYILWVWVWVCGVGVGVVMWTLSLPLVLCMYVCMYVCLYVCMYVYVNVYMTCAIYIYIYIHV